MKTFGLLILIAIPWTIQAQCDVEVYLDLSGTPKIGQELDPTKTSLDSLLLAPHDIAEIYEDSFAFTLTENASKRLRMMNLDTKPFTLVINEQRVLAGWFWDCYSSLGTKGYVTFNLNCGDEERDELRIKYSLPSQDFPDKDLIKNACGNRR